MGRRKQFERDDVIEATITVFRRKGFEATKIQEVVEAVGLNRSSIYAEFGSKEGLFDEAIERYMSQGVGQKIIDAPRDEPILELLQRLLTPIIENASSGEDSTGCLLIAAVMESDAPSGPFMQRIRAHLQQIEANLYARILIAQERGEISGENDAMAMSRAFISGLHGLRVTSKAIHDPEILGDIVNQLLRLVAGGKLDLTPAITNLH